MCTYTHKAALANSHRHYITLNVPVAVAATTHSNVERKRRAVGRKRYKGALDVRILPDGAVGEGYDRAKRTDRKVRKLDAVS
jgi:hypothetical protein